MGVLLWIVTVAVILVRKLFRAVPSRSSVQPPRTPAASSSITFETCSHRSLAPIDLMELANSPSRRNAVGLEPRKNIQQYASIAVLPYLGLTQPDWPEKFYMLSRRVLLKKYETNAVLAHMAKFDGFPQAALDCMLIPQYHCLHLDVLTYIYGSLCKTSTCNRSPECRSSPCR